MKIRHPNNQNYNQFLKCHINVVFSSFISLACFLLSIEGCFSARSERESFIPVNFRVSSGIALFYYLQHLLNEEIKKDARMA